MKYFKLTFANGISEYAKAENALALIKSRDLATKEHINTRIMELSGEMAGIAQDWLENN